eukprot:5167607-Pyramimonas_sp.AAC.1
MAFRQAAWMLTAHLSPLSPPPPPASFFFPPPPHPPDSCSQGSEPLLRGHLGARPFERRGMPPAGLMRSLGLRHIILAG